MKKLSLALTILFLLAVMVCTAAASTLDIRYWQEAHEKEMRAAGKVSDDLIYSVRVYLSDLANGNVTGTVYKTVYENETFFSFSNVTVLPINEAHSKLTNFLFYLDNTDDQNWIGVAGTREPDDNVVATVYGPSKNATLDAFVAGIPDCLANPKIYGYSSGGHSSSSKTNMEEAIKNYKDPEWAAKYVASVFTIGDTTLSSPISATTVTMDVSPYIKNDRTYVPVRYLAYALGVAENDVTWDGDTQQVGITKDDTQISLTIGSTAMIVNGQPVTMDVTPEITDDRTFLPARWIAEALGASVEWNEETSQAIIILPEG